MNESLTLDGLTAALRVLRVLAVDFGHLPAPCVDLTPIEPERLRLAFHNGLHAFEAWREALDMAPEDVTYHVQGDGTTRVLTASTAFAGAEVHLTGYGDAPESDGGAA